RRLGRCDADPGALPGGPAIYQASRPCHRALVARSGRQGHGLAGGPAGPRPHRPTVGKIVRADADGHFAPQAPNERASSMIDLSDHQLIYILLVSLLVILGASETGRQLGMREGDKAGENIATMEQAILGLLALMIGFTFAMALSRFEARR